MFCYDVTLQEKWSLEEQVNELGEELGRVVLSKDRACDEKKRSVDELSMTKKVCHIFFLCASLVLDRYIERYVKAFCLLFVSHY